MGERRQVAAGADGAAAGHHRMHARVERVDQPIERLAADAGVALGQHVGAQRHHRPHGARRQRLATPAAWLRSRFRCSSPSALFGIFTSASEPKPVLMP